MLGKDADSDDEIDVGRVVARSHSSIFAKQNVHTLKMPFLSVFACRSSFAGCLPRVDVNDDYRPSLLCLK